MILIDEQSGRPKVVYVSWIAATPERVFEALTRPEFTQRWLGVPLRSGWTAGDPIVFDMGGTEVEAGRVIDADPPRRLVYSSRGQGEPDSRVTMDIEPHDEVVKLTVTHDEFPLGSAMPDSFERGWPAVISSLKSVIERGDDYAGPAAQGSPPPLPDIAGAGGRKPETVYSVYVDAPPRRVWEALTQSDLVRRYFIGRTAESDWKEGSDWRLVMEDGRTDVEGKVLISDPPSRLRLSWRVEGLPEFRDLPECWVDYIIEPMGEATRLTMMESYAEPLADWLLEGGRSGWPAILSGLKSVLETGRSLKLPAMKPPEAPEPAA